GRYGDTISAGDGNNLVIGDSGKITAAISNATQQLGGIPMTLGLIETTEYGDGGADTITTLDGLDIVLGGHDGDVIDAGNGNNIVLGDEGLIDYVTADANPSDIDLITSTSTMDHGGVDTIATGDGDDIIIGGRYGDTINGGNGHNLVIGDSGRILAALSDVIRQLGGIPMTLGLIETTEPQDGGNDSIDTGSGNDLILGGLADDTIVGGDGNNVVFGDNGLIDYVLTDGDPSDIDLITTREPNLGGADLITTGSGFDMIFGGTGGDTIHAGSNNDLVFGDHGKVEGDVDATQLPLATNDDPFTFTAIDTQDSDGGGDDWIAGEAGDDIILGQQGTDTIFGGEGDDDIFGGHNVVDGHDAGDFIDAGADDDAVAGDNAMILRRGDNLSPRMQVLGGSVIYDASGTALVTGGTRGNPDVVYERDIVLYNHSDDPTPGTWGADFIAGGPDDDTIFGQLGDDTIQGDAGVALLADGGVDFNAVAVVQLGHASVENWVTDGRDYIEGNGGDDLLFGNLGQDDIVGDNSSLFGLASPAQRTDGADVIFGGAGNAHDLARNSLGDYDPEVPPSRGADADTILGDNGNIFRLVGTNGVDSGKYLTFNYDLYDWFNYDGQERLIPRAVTFEDYTPGNGTASDRGQDDLIHGEAGDDTIYGLTGNDVLFGEAQDDDLYGGDGADRIYGGTGEDGIVGDNGLILTSRNRYTEPLNGLFTAAGEVMVDLTGGLPVGTWEHITDRIYKSFVAVAWEEGGSDILYGGQGDDWMHGGAGDDAMSGAEALPEFYTEAPQVDLDPLGYDPVSRKLAAYDADFPLLKIENFLLNFEAYGEDGQKVEDGKDRMFGDFGNDWLVGGTGKDRMFGGLGDDLLNADDNHETNGGLNNMPDNIAFTAPDLAYGGGGLDVLIGNTGGDRLIDWGGEFNTYVVPFGPFGEPGVVKSPSPGWQAFLLELAENSGADQSLAEPHGEIGLVTHRDAEWGDQHGGPRDPQQGNLGGVGRDTRGEFEDDRTPDFWPTLAGSTPAGGTVEVATITGMKFEDLDRDGVQDAGEPGLGGWTIYLDADNDGVLDAGETARVTAGDGAYAFTGISDGTYTVREVMQDGWVQTFPGTGSHSVIATIGEITSGVDFGNYSTHDGSIAGTKFEDIDGDGLRDEGESGLGGWTIYLDADNDNALDEGEKFTVTTADGGYLFRNLAAGTYVVREVMQEGWTQTFPGAGFHAVALAAGQASTGNSFGNMPSTTNLYGTIAGMKFEDLDHDGIREEGERGLSGWAIYLDTNNNDMLDTGEFSTITAADGSYRFSFLSAGNYTVREVMQEGWQQSAPAEGYHAVDLATGATSTGNDFGNYQPVVVPKGSIGNFIWQELYPIYQKGNNGVGNGLDPQPPGNPPINDGVGTSPGDPGNTGGGNVKGVPTTPGKIGSASELVNGIQDAGEPGIAGVVVNLIDSLGNIVMTTTTDASGYYLFEDLVAGGYIVEVDGSNFLAGGILEGWSATPQDQGTDDSLDSDGDPLTYRSAMVSLAAGERNSDADFGFYLPGLNQKGNNGVGNGLDPQPPGNPPINDGYGTSPGNPGNTGLGNESSGSWVSNFILDLGMQDDDPNEEIAIVLPNGKAKNTK
ncbi:MAG: hypothetical protein C4576_03520, partial [Desulfobacteraceae bacterium]